MKSTLAWMEYCKSLAPAIVEACARTAVSAGPSALVKALPHRQIAQTFSPGALGRRIRAWPAD